MEAVEVLSIPSIDSFIHGWRMIGSCNGLLCVLVVHDLGRSASSLWLWNPVIREVREIPQTTDDWGFCTYGFGFSSIVHDYKIVRFYNQELRKKKEISDLTCYDGADVYSSSTGSWKELEFEFGALHPRRFICEAVNVNGTICWLGVGPFAPIVVSFDIASEVFTLTPMEVFTLTPTEHTILSGLGVYDNKLEVHSLIKEFSGSHFICAWVMEEVASESGKRLSPTQKYRIETMSDMLQPECIWRNEIVFLDLKIESEGGAGPRCVLHMFNLITNEWRKFNCSNAYNCCGVFNYEKSLVSVWNNQVE